MSYWGWDNPQRETLYRNTCGPNATEESIEESAESIVWLAIPRAEDVCLDLGCGIGRVEKFLATSVKEIHAVDFSETMLRVARERLHDTPNVFFYENDGESLSMFPTAMFNLAWAELVFHHIPIEITRRYMSEVARVLKPSGRFACQLPLKDFYELESRDICGWMTLDEAKELLAMHFDRATVWQDGRHIYALVYAK